MSRVMVLAAGLGTRLRPLTEELPKPLVPIGDRCLLDHIAGALERAGFDSLVLNTHWLPNAFPSALEGLRLRVDVVHEPTIRGTAGGVAGARHLLDTPPILVWNGDILVEPPIRELLARSGEGLSMAVMQRACGEGTVGLDGAGNVVRLRGERFGEEASGGDYVGVAALGARCLAELPEVGCLIGDWALPELRRGGRVTSVPISGGWTDAGDAASYQQANQGWLDRMRIENWIAEDAVVAPSVRLRRTIVGSKARVNGRGTVENVVVWPRAELEAPLARAIVTTRGRIVPIT